MRENGFYAQVDDAADMTKPATLYVKQARPHPGRGADVVDFGVSP